MQISVAEFTYPSWLSFGAMRLLTRILDPNPMTVCTHIAIQRSQCVLYALYDVC